MRFRSQVSRLINGILFDGTKDILLPVSGSSDVANLPWTPIDSSGAGLAFSVAVGEYLKISDRILFTGQVTYPATASGVSAVIGGLPYTASGKNTAVAIGYQLGGVAGLQARVQAATALIIFTVEITAVEITNAQLTGAILVFSGAYRIA